MQLCLVDLVEVMGGQLRLAAMPPREGELTAVSRIVFSPGAVIPGDVFWSLTLREGEIEQAFAGGALGVVLSARRVEPWPGRFCLTVDDAIAALERLVGALLRHSDPAELRWLTSLARETKQFSRCRAELKVLQLCAQERADIYPLACGQAADAHRANRRRRRAA